MCRQIPLHTDVYVTKEVFLFSDDTVHSLKKKNYSIQMLWIKHINYGYWCAECLCPCVLEINLRAVRNKELQSRRTLITVLPLNKSCQSCLASVLPGLLQLLRAIAQKSDWRKNYLPLLCIPVGHGTPTWLKQNLMLPLYCHDSRGLGASRSFTFVEA